MIRINDIQSSLSNLVGWRQDYNPNKQIDPLLTNSTSGLYFQDAHPLMTLDNIRGIMPEDYILQYPAWDNTENYIEGAKVQYNDKVYKIFADFLHLCKPPK